MFSIIYVLFIRKVCTLFTVTLITYSNDWFQRHTEYLQGSLLCQLAYCQCPNKILYILKIFHYLALDETFHACDCVGRFQL